MHPILFTIGGVQVRVYTVMAFVAMMCSMAAAISEAHRLKWDVRGAMWQTVRATLIGFLGSHILYAITRLNDLSGWAWWKMLFNIGHGHVWFGGFLLAWAHCEWYARRHKIPSLQMWDVAAFAVLLANPVGRIGCFFNGCCYGKPSDLPWSVFLYTKDYPAGASLHPVPLYEFIYQIGLFAALWSIRRRNRHDGQTAVRYLILMPAGRFALEFVRGDTIRGFVFGLISTSQAIALGLVAAGIALYAYQRKKHRDFTFLPSP